MPIYTAGYGNRGFEPFIDLLKRYGVTHLVDVRSVPQSSYWQDFRRERLQHMVPSTGLRYVYMGDTLGGVSNSPVLCKDPEAVPLPPLLEDPRFHLGLDKLIDAAAKGDRVICLMCGCLRPQGCHRSRLIGEGLARRGISLMHIDEAGEVVSQADLVERSRPLQSALF